MKDLMTQWKIERIDPNKLHEKDLKKVSDIFAELENRYATMDETEYIETLLIKLEIHKELKKFMKQIGMKAPKFKVFFREGPGWNYSERLEYKDKHKEVYAYTTDEHIVMKIHKFSSDIYFEKCIERR